MINGEVIRLARDQNIPYENLLKMSLDSYEQVMIARKQEIDQREKAMKKAER